MLIVTYTYWTRPTLPSCRMMSCLPGRLLPSCLHTVSSSHPDVTCLCPSIPQKIPPPVTPCSPVYKPLPSNSALATTARFLFPRPIFRQNIFYSAPQLCPWGCFTPPGLKLPPPYVLTRLLLTNLVYWPQRHPLRYHVLSPVDIHPQSLSTCFPENT